MKISNSKATTRGPQSRLPLQSKVSIIAAVAQNGAIGRQGGIPWHLSEDFKYFKKVTLGHPVVMGYGTWLSMGCRALPGRRNIVVSRNHLDESCSAADFFPDIVSAVSSAVENDGGETFIIGGGTLYRQAIGLADKLYITQVMASVPDADTFFPEINPSVWRETSRSELMHDAAGGPDFAFVVYERLGK